MSSSLATADCGMKLVITDSVLFFVSLCTLIARLFARLLVDNERIVSRVNFRRLRIDDYLMCAAVLLQIGHVSSISIAFTYGLGKHISTLSMYSKMHALKVIQVVKAFSLVPSTTARVSIALYQSRFLPRDDKLRWSLIGVIGVDVFINVVALIQMFTQCGSNSEALWNPMLDKVALCSNAEIETFLGYAQSGYNSVCDLFLTIFPGVILWNLKISRQKKWQVYCVLATSCLALVASVIKTIEIGALNKTDDFTWGFVALQIWVAIEVNVILITGNFPSMYPLLKMFWRRHVTTHGSSTPTVYLVSSIKQRGSGMSRGDSAELAILKTTDYAISIREEKFGHIPGSQKPVIVEDGVGNAK